MQNGWIRGLSIAALALIFGVTPGSLLWAQHRQGGGVVRSGGPALPPIPNPYRNGVGSSVFPGTGGPPAGRIYGGTTVRPPRNNGGGGHHNGRGGRTPAYVPYVYPMYWGDSFWNNSYPPSEPASEPAPEPMEQPERPEAPPVIINQYFTTEPMNPAMREYRPGDLPPAAAARPQAETTPPSEPQQEEFYKLAFKDGTVQLVRGYSVTGNTISFVTPYGSVRRVTMDQFDEEMTEKLNRPAK